jgi:hypothetical protein
MRLTQKSKENGLAGDPSDSLSAERQTSRHFVFFGLCGRKDIAPAKHATPPGTSTSIKENVLGPVPGVDVMAKRPQGWVRCEDHLLYHNFIYLLDSTTPRRGTREDLGGGARGPGPARVGLLGLQCSARALFRTASFNVQNKMTQPHRIFRLNKALSLD